MANLKSSKSMHAIAALSTVLGLAGVFLAGDARADVTARTVNGMSTDGRLILFMSDGGVYYASFDGSLGGCPQANVDVWKSWVSLAQAAKLSGHTLDLGIAPAAGTCGVSRIVWVKLN